MTTLNLTRISSVYLRLLLTLSFRSCRLQMTNLIIILSSVFSLLFILPYFQVFSSLPLHYFIQESIHYVK